MACEYSGMLDELLNRPAGELRLIGSDGTNDDDTGRDDDDETDEDEEDEDDDESDSDDKSKKKPAKAKPKTAAEVAAMERRIANFDEERDRDKAKIKKLGEEKTTLSKEITRLKSEGVKDEEVKQRNTELESSNARLQAANDDLRIQIAFLGDKTHNWVNPAAAVKLLDRSNIEIDDKGRVTGLKTALDELVEQNAYLLVQPAKDSDDDADGEDDKSKRPAQRKTGDQPGSQRKGSSRSQQARDDRLRQRFSGLRGQR